jgi:hypothetical protein
MSKQESGRLNSEIRGNCDLVNRKLNTCLAKLMK